MTRRTWAWILGGIAFFLFVAFLAVVGAGMYLLGSHMRIETVSRQSAEQQFERERARFAGQKPLIEAGGFDEPARIDPSRRPAPGRIDDLHVLAYSAREDKLVRLSIPFWILRLKRQSIINLPAPDDSEFGRLRITVDDLERYGPGLLLDRREPGGTRVLLWLQ
ncbi:MAG: hypothetical protein HYX76_02295 [Acidobacteria bacterium]|nr:hypothetical protein [Acidobacteriota bacterium]